MAEIKARVVTDFPCRECGGFMEWIGIEDDGYVLQCPSCDDLIQTLDVRFNFRVEISLG